MDSRSEPLAEPFHPHGNDRVYLVPYEHLPEWYQDNPWIRSGYRPVSNSANACFRSWVRLHNEVVNIHSHLFAAIAFLLAEAYILEPLSSKYPRVSVGDYAVLTIFLSSATICFGLSAAYHTFICHSQKVETIWLRLDFVGIILLILGSFATGIYVGFWCEQLQRTIYWAMVSVLSTVGRYTYNSSFLIDRWPWRYFHLRDAAPKIPRTSMENVSSIDPHEHWSIWNRTYRPWYLLVRLSANEPTIRLAVLLGRRSNIFAGSHHICSRLPIALVFTTH